MAFVPKITINETNEGFVHPYSQTPFATREAMWADLQQNFSPNHDWQRQDIEYVEKGTHGQFKRPPAALAGMLDLDALTAARKKRTQQKAQQAEDHVSDEDRRASEQRHPSQGPRPIIPMNPSSSRRRGGGSREEGAGTETGQNLANLMGSIVKESTTGKRYSEEGTHGQDFDPEDHDGRPNDPMVLKELYERDQAVQRLNQKDPWRERGPWGIVRNKDQTFDYVKEGTEGQPGLTDVIGATGHEYSQNLQAVRHASPGGFIEGIAKLPDAPSMRAKGSRGHFDAGHA